MGKAGRDEKVEELEAMSRGPGSDVRKTLYTVCMGDGGAPLVYCCSVSLNDGVVIGQDGSDLAAVPLRRQRVSSAIPSVSLNVIGENGSDLALARQRLRRVSSALPRAPRLDYYTVPDGSSSSPAAASTTVLLRLVGQNHENNIVTGVILHREPEQLPPPPPPRRCSLLFGAFGSVYALAMPASDDVDSAPPSLYIDSAAGGWGESIPLPFETRCCTAAEPPTVGYAEIEPHHLILFCVSHHKLHEFHIFHVPSKSWEKPLAVVHPSYKPDPKLDDPYTRHPPHRPERCCSTIPFIQRAAFVSGSGSGVICGLHSSGSSLVIYGFSPICTTNINYRLQLLLHSSLETLNPHLPVSTFGQPFPSLFPVAPLSGPPSLEITCLGDDILSLVGTSYELSSPDKFVPIYFTTFRLENKQPLPRIMPLDSTFRLGGGGGGGRDLSHLRVLCTYPSSDVAYWNPYEEEEEAQATATTLLRGQDISDYYYSKLDAEFFKIFFNRPEKSGYSLCLYSRFKDRLEERALTDDIDGNVKRFLQFMSSDAVDPFVLVGPEVSVETPPRINTDLYLVATFPRCSLVYKLSILDGKIFDDGRKISPHALGPEFCKDASFSFLGAARMGNTLRLFSQHSPSRLVAQYYRIHATDAVVIESRLTPTPGADTPFAAIGYDDSTYYVLSGHKICGPYRDLSEGEPLASAHNSPVVFKKLIWYAVVDEHILISVKDCDSCHRLFAYNVQMNKWTTALAENQVAEWPEFFGLTGKAEYIDGKIYVYSGKLGCVFQFGVTKSGDSLHLRLMKQLDLTTVIPLCPRDGLSFSGSMTYLGNMTFCAIFSDRRVADFQYASVTIFAIVGDDVKLLHSKVCVLDTLCFGMAEVHYCCSL
ncbi:hypothetical protein Tsubulata_021305 [Turnera subulata]|uniref:Uncharacterized protein n=1 Tax=Turnera subulata TaxID=218843 RepID=A0A9Q0FRL0_9ROSI|nr:hypothetical protein Tsubulata_021305 [Turnera subulata]